MLGSLSPARYGMGTPSPTGEVSEGSLVLVFGATPRQVLLSTVTRALILCASHFWWATHVGLSGRQTHPLWYGGKRETGLTNVQVAKISV